ncbi:hypothetical protein K7I13_02550 [Brucepastera parasyntrophica]|uniref:hypothetical protein n=1 Tax=Brucepastera parasyntrophica TaxID=2880008 RepID=UPI002108A0F0|nr:hypothetical protein [Brucepastera parasyntrophica]ULQ60215.1 hypothetical protein K7I13_02550 [Brucepastera parasyntrophica]
MKRLHKIILLCLSFFLIISNVYAAEIELFLQAGNFAFDDSGDLQQKKPKFGFGFSISEQIRGNIIGNIAFDSDPLNGNLLKARIKYQLPYLELSLGPSFGIFNSGSDKDKYDISIFMQPGLGIGFTIRFPGIFFAGADCDFALSPPQVFEGQVFLQQGSITLGVYLPNILLSAKVTQKNNTLMTNADPRVKTATDYGIYTEAFKKGSPFRGSVNFIYRILNFHAGSASTANKEIANLIVGGGLTWSPNINMSIYVQGNGCIYSFSLADEVDGLNKFMFEAKAGVIFVIGGNR